MHFPSSIIHNWLPEYLPLIVTSVNEPRLASVDTVTFPQDQLKTLPRVDKDNKRINSKRYSYDYIVGGQEMKRIFDPAKLEHRWSGPYEIIQVHINGNIIIQVNPHLRERLNIRRVKPYKQPTPSALQHQQQQLGTPL